MTYGLIVTIDQWQANPGDCAKRARKEARREGAKRWEVAVEIDGQVLTKASGKV